jgi:hypothetical protein
MVRKGDRGESERKGSILKKNDAGENWKVGSRRRTLC